MAIMSSYSYHGRSRVWIPRDEEENRAIFSAMRQETGIAMPEEFKPVYLENEEYEVEKWRPKQLIKLLRLYGSHRCLWDHNDTFHKNRKMRKAAMVDITAAMGKDVTMEMVSQKINVVRSTYRYEKRRIKQRIRKGVGAKTKLKWFALADCFLRSVPRAEKFKKTDVHADSDSDLEDTVVFTIDPEILIPLEEDNSGNQNCINIGDDNVLPADKNDPAVSEIFKQTNEIHQMLENQKEESMYLRRKTSQWKLRQMIRFLKIYREHKCLWNNNDPTYKERLRKENAVKSMAQEIGGGISEKQVVRKINTLKSIYRSERKKLAGLYSKGKSPESKLKWYPFADSFLRRFCTVKQTKNFGSEKLRSEALEFMDEENDRLHSENDKQEASENNDFNDILSYNSEPNSFLKIGPIAGIKSESSCDDEKRFPILPNEILRVPNIVIERHWMQSDSIKFVKLLKNHSCLWDSRNSTKKTTNEQNIVFEDIALKMNMPAKRIRKKLKILLKTYYAEKKKSKLAFADNIFVKTDFIWYNLVDEFLGCNEDMTNPVVPLNFVDPDLMSPAPSILPDSNEDKKIKQETPDSSNEFDLNDFVDAVDFPQPCSLISCSPKTQKTNKSSKLVLLPHLEKISQTFSELEEKPKNLTENSIWSVKTEEPSVGNFSKLEANDQPRKIVWNGLEDDLLEGKWSFKHSVKFLRLYGAHRCLWDLKSSDHRVRELRDAAIEDIAAAMGHGLSSEYVSKKIKIFRITYMQHRKRMLESLKAEKEPEIQLRWFPLADSFLRPHIGLRSIKPGEKEVPQFDFQYVYSKLNLIDPALLNDFEGKGTQNSIQLGGGSCGSYKGMNIAEQVSSEDEEEDDFDDGFFKEQFKLVRR